MTEPNNPTVLGHPTSLFALFFTEMWERFSYYGMRALLVFYMIKGFLKYTDGRAYSVYGAYTALVYMTPFIGGILADRLLGSRRAVVLGGLLMAAGHLMMTVEHEFAFFFALSLLICGNGFFKPNISTIVGSLYPHGSPKRDSGFTIFYMGINLGAAMSPLICGYVGETYGWHYGFGLATIGMLCGLAIFIAPVKLAQVLIAGCAGATALSMLFLQNNSYQLVVNIFVGAALVTAGVIAFIALNRGGLPKEVGAPKSKEALSRSFFGFIRRDVAVYLGIFIAVPFLMLLVKMSEIAGYLLVAFGVAAMAWLIVETVRSTWAERRRLFVVFVLMFFSLLFWSFFEQAGSSMNNFTDRNIDRVFEESRIAEADVGKTIRLKITQEQVGYANGLSVLHSNDLDDARAAGKAEVDWAVTNADVGMRTGGAEIPASLFQATNPIFVLLFGVVFTGLWSFLGKRRMEPSAPVKFSFALLQLALGFLALWWGANTADGRGMVEMRWLILGYLFQTTGELCISPVGLSMVTNLSPRRIVSTVMGAWLLAMAFSNYLAGVIAAFTGVGNEGPLEKVIPLPIETVAIYGDIFGKIALTAAVSGLICLALAPLLNRWMSADDGITSNPNR
jgi:POT family proton-dependent oligopeptide transporter